MSGGSVFSSHPKGRSTGPIRKYTIGLTGFWECGYRDRYLCGNMDDMNLRKRDGHLPVAATEGGTWSRCVDAQAFWTQCKFWALCRWNKGCQDDAAWQGRISRCRAWLARLWSPVVALEEVAADSGRNDCGPPEGLGQEGSAPGKDCPHPGERSAHRCPGRGASSAPRRIGA